MALTRIQIIDEALAQVGRTDLTSNARLWLNLFLEKIYKTQDWGWLLKTSDGLSISDGGAVPTDYWKLKSMSLLVTSNGATTRSPVYSIEADKWANRRLSIGDGTGQPKEVYINRQARTFHFWPTPDQTYSFDLLYYYLPTLPTHTTSAADNVSPVWGEHDDFLIRAIQLKAMFFNDDARYDAEEKALMGELITAKMNSYDNRAGHNRLKLGKSFRRRF